MKHLILFFCTVVILASCQQNDPPAPSANNNNNNNNNTTSMTPTEQALVGRWHWVKTEYYDVQGNVYLVRDTNYYDSLTPGAGTMITEFQNVLYYPQPGPANPPIATRYSSLSYYGIGGYGNGFWYVDPPNSYWNGNPKSKVWHIGNPLGTYYSYIDSLTSNILITTSWWSYTPTQGVKDYYFK